MLLLRLYLGESLRRCCSVMIISSDVVVFHRQFDTVLSLLHSAAALERMTAAINASSGTSGHRAGDASGNAATGGSVSGTGNQQNQNDWGSRITRGLARLVSFG